MNGHIRHIKIGGLLLFGLVQASFLHASGPGTTAANVLRVGIGARAIGMGEAYTALADDVSSLFWNPGGLALLQERQASFMYSQWLKDLKYHHLALGIPLENGALGTSLSYLTYGAIDGYDTQGNPTGGVSAYSGVATLGGAWLGGGWTLGFNIKGIQESLADVKANGVAYDVGATVLYPKPVLGGTLRAGAALQNLGSGLTFIQQTDPFPRQWRVGLAAVQMLNKKLNISADYVQPREDNGSLLGGVEYWVTSFFALRTGYAGTQDAGRGVRAGIGFRFRGISFDYAYAGYRELGLAHRYEMSFRFGEPRPILNAEERKIYRRAKVALREGRYEQAVLLFNSLIETEPHFRKARRLLTVAMAGMEEQERTARRRKGTPYQAPTPEPTRPAPLPELDDLERLLRLSESAVGESQNVATVGGSSTPMREEKTP